MSIEPGETIRYESENGVGKVTGRTRPPPSIPNRMAIAMEKWALDNHKLVDKCTSREMSIGMARAALEAIREPTSEMVGAAPGHSDIRKTWRAMIDEAMKELSDGTQTKSPENSPAVVR